MRSAELSSITNADYDEVDRVCTPDKKIIEILLQKYKTYRTPSEEGVTVWIEVWFNLNN